MANRQQRPFAFKALSFAGLGELRISNAEEVLGVLRRHFVWILLEVLVNETTSLGEELCRHQQKKKNQLL